MKAMKKWMRAATQAQKQELARLAGTTLGTLGFVSSTSRESISSILACRLERGTEKIRAKDPKLPVVRREQLSTACAQCEFAKRCRE